MSGLRFFLDRGLGSRIVPQALRDAGWALETMDERYGKDSSQHIQDTLSNAALTGRDMAQWYLAHKTAIAETAMQVSGPYVMSVNLTSGLRRTKLAFPAR